MSRLRLGVVCVLLAGVGAGGVVAVVAAEVGPAHTEVLFGALGGIAAGAGAEALQDRRAHRGPVDETPLPPHPDPHGGAAS
jgi:hypothetical protein